MHPFAQSHGGGENPQKVDEDAISVRIVITSPILDPIQIVFFSKYCMLDKLTFFVDTACESLSPAPPVQCCRFDHFIYSTTNDVFLPCHQYKKIMAPANLGEVPRVDSHGMHHTWETCQHLPQKSQEKTQVHGVHPATTM